MNAPSVTLKTDIPETAAASGFPPTAYRFLPNVVLFQMNHTTTIATTAQMIIVGKLPIVGMNIFGIAESIAPNETPFVAYVTSPKMISIEIRGRIERTDSARPRFSVFVVSVT